MSTEAFDLNALVARLGGDLEHTRDLVELFLSYELTMIGDLRNAVEAGDSEAIASNAHRTKGALASIHAEAARGLCERLEDQNLSVSGATGLFAELELAWESLCVALAEYLQSVTLSPPHGCGAQSEQST